MAKNRGRNRNRGESGSGSETGNESGTYNQQRDEQNAANLASLSMMHDYEDVEVDSLKNAIQTEPHNWVISDISNANSRDRSITLTSVNNTTRGEPLKVSIDRGALRNLLINGEQGDANLKDVLDHLTSDMERYSFGSNATSVHLKYDIEPNSEHETLFQYGGNGEATLDVAMMTDMSKTQFNKDLTLIMDNYV